MPESLQNQYRVIWYLMKISHISWRCFKRRQCRIWSINLILNCKFNLKILHFNSLGFFTLCCLCGSNKTRLELVWKTLFGQRQLFVKYKNILSRIVVLFLLVNCLKEMVSFGLEREERRPWSLSQSSILNFMNEEMNPTDQLLMKVIPIRTAIPSGILLFNINKLFWSWIYWNCDKHLYHQKLW